MSTNFVLGSGKTLEMPLPTVSFDENNAKYLCCFKKLHVKNAARLISISLVIGVFINIFYSFSRSPTVIVYSWVLAAFSIGVYGSLIYATHKDKRNFTIPFLVFQAIFIVLLGLLFFSFMICAMFSTKTLISLAVDMGGIDPSSNIDQLTAGVRGFVVLVMVFWVIFICLQCWYFEIIYRFYHYLEDRESSFNFNLDSEFRITPHL